MTEHSPGHRWELKAFPNHGALLFSNPIQCVLTGAGSLLCPHRTQHYDHIQNYTGVHAQTYYWRHLHLHSIRFRHRSKSFAPHNRLPDICSDKHPLASRMFPPNICLLVGSRPVWGQKCPEIDCTEANIRDCAGGTCRSGKGR